MRRSGLAVLAACGVLLAGCGGATDPGASDTLSSAPTDSSSGEDSTTTTAAAISAPPTTAPDPTIFVPNNLVDPRELQSFVLTVVEAHSSNGVPYGRTSTIGYTNEPSNAYVEIQYSGGDSSKDYFVDGRTLQLNNQNFWYLFESGSPAAPNILYELDNSDALSDVTTAVFAGEEDFAGVAAYHFTFDETNLQNYSSYTTDRPSPEVEGDFFVAQDGGYVIYAHSRQVAAGEGYELIDEFTETLSSVNQLAAITVPADMQPLNDALDLGLTLGLPMPTDGVLDSMINYNDGGIGVYYYQYKASWASHAEFLDFYLTLQPTNGWTVAHIGQVKNLDIHCDEGNCVILKNGDQQFILYLEGGNLHADYDREHRFGPCTQPASPTYCG